LAAASKLDIRGINEAARKTPASSVGALNEQDVLPNRLAALQRILEARDVNRRIRMRVSAVERENLPAHERIFVGFLDALPQFGAGQRDGRREDDFLMAVVCLRNDRPE
jgi:hypothetical protein